MLVPTGIVRFVYDTSIYIELTKGDKRQNNFDARFNYYVAKHI